MYKKIKGVIFDFNGTLFFDSDKHEKAWIKISTEVRASPLTSTEISTKVHGRTNKTILEYLFQKEISNGSLSAYILKKENYYRQSCLKDKKNLKFVKGATELFDFLLDNQIKMTIATASEITNLNFFNKEFGLDQWFNLNNIVYDDGRIEGKPAPDMFLKAAKLIELKPSECLVFEDSESGIAAANYAGIGRIIIIDPSKEKSKFQNHPDVDLVIEDFSKLNRSLYF